MILRIMKVAEQEVRLGIRNKWLLFSTLILAILSIVLAILGSTSSSPLDADRLTITVASLSTLSVYLISLIALLLAYDAICGEVERGTLLMTFSCPITRTEFLFGKVLGHIVVLIVSILIGYGSVGVTIMLFNDFSTFGLVALIRLIGTSIVLGLCFLSVGYLLSTLTRQSRTAAAMSIGTWIVLIVIYDLILLGMLITFPSGFFAELVFPYAILVNPADSFRLFNLAALGASDLVGGLAGVSETLPFNPAFALGSMAIFIFVFLSLAAIQIRRVIP